MYTDITHEPTLSSFYAFYSTFQWNFYPFQLLQFQRDFAGQFGSGRRALAQRIEETEGNIRWMEDNYDTVLEWLKQQNNEGEAETSLKIWGDGNRCSS